MPNGIPDICIFVLLASPLILIFGNHPMNSEAFSIAILTVTDVALYDYSGEKVNRIEVGEQVLATISIHNNIESNQSFVAIIEIRDGYGITRELSWQSGDMDAGDDYTFGVSWIPTDDCLLDNDECSNYQIRGFLVTSLNNPQILSPVSVMEGITVIGFPPNPPLDQYQFDVSLDDGRTYTIDYSFSRGDGTILAVEDNHENDTLRVKLETPVDTTFTVSIPTFLINYFLGNEQMSSYEIRTFVDGKVVQPGSLIDREARNWIFIFSLKQGAEDIEIVGIPSS